MKILKLFDLGILRAIDSPMNNVTNALLTSSMALIAATTSACTPTESDQSVAIAKSGDSVVISTSTLVSGGFGCGGLATPGDGPLYVSNDRGATFARLDLDTIDAPVTALTAHQQAFYALRDRLGGYSIETSIDGQRWTTVASGTDHGYNLVTSGDTLAMMHDQGLLVSRDGRTWTDRALPAQMYNPVFTVAGASIVVADHSGVLYVAGEAKQWTTLTLPGVTQLHRLATIEGDAVALVHATRGSAVEQPFLVQVNLEAPEMSSFIAVDESISDLLDAPAATLFNDGSAAADRTQLATRAARTDAFVAGAVDGNDVVLLHDHSITISHDGGRSFDAAIELPLR